MNRLAAPAGSRVFAEGLSKRYGECDALVDVNLEVTPGQVIALVGPNGAGKSTLLKALAGLVIPTRGRAFIDGLPAGSVAARERIGYLPQRVVLPEEMQVEELLRFFAGLRSSLCAGPGGSRRLDRAVRGALEAAGLHGFESRTIRQLSGGMVQRLGLAQALLGNPPVLLLDEPAAALDADARARLRLSLDTLRREGRSAVVATHLLDEAAAVADRVVALRSGRVVADEAIEAFRRRLESRLVIDAGEPARAVKVLRERGYRAAALATEPMQVSVQCEPGGAVDALNLLAQARCPIRSFRTERISLQELLEHYLKPAEAMPPDSLSPDGQKEATGQ